VGRWAGWHLDANVCHHGDAQFVRGTDVGRGLPDLLELESSRLHLEWGSIAVRRGHFAGRTEGRLDLDSGRVHR